MHSWGFVFFSLTQERHLEDIKTRGLSKHSNACDDSDVGFVNIWHILVASTKTVKKEKKKEIQNQNPLSRRGAGFMAR